MDDKEKDTQRPLSDTEKWLFKKIQALERRVYNLEHGYTTK